MIALGSDHGGYELKQEIRSIWMKRELIIKISAVTVKRQ